MFVKHFCRVMAAVATLGGLLGPAAAADAGRVLPDPLDRWVVYYGPPVASAALKSYDLVVLDPQAAASMVPTLTARRKTVLAYLSLGEINRAHPWFATVEGMGLTGAENPNWPGAFSIDLRDRRWTAMVVEDLVPDLLRRGFHGVFIDTLDTALHLEATDPKAYAGMGEAAVRLIATLRRHYPTLLIAVNRAYPIVPKLAPSIDLVVGESVMTGYDFTRRAYRRLDDETARSQQAVLKDALRYNPALRLLTIDYADPADQALRTTLYREQRKAGFVPYVATIDLRQIVPENGPENGPGDGPQ